MRFEVETNGNLKYSSMIRALRKRKAVLRGTLGYVSGFDCIFAQFRGTTGLALNRLMSTLERPGRPHT